MSQNESITEMIEGVRRGTTNAGQLFLRYQQGMEHYARKKIGTTMQHAYSGSDVYSESFTAVIQCLRASTEQVRSRGQFLAQLVTTINNRIIDAYRRESALKRGNRPKLSLSDELAVPTSAPGPAEEAAAREQTLLVQTFLESIDDPMKRMAATARCVYFSSTPEIRRLLSTLFPQDEVPSEATIGRWNRAAMAELAKHLS